MYSINQGPSVRKFSRVGPRLVGRRVIDHAELGWTDLLAIHFNSKHDRDAIDPSDSVHLLTYLPACRCNIRHAACSRIWTSTCSSTPTAWTIIHPSGFCVQRALTKSYYSVVASCISLLKATNKCSVLSNVRIYSVVAEHILSIYIQCRK
jgi:hypothetical protein